MSFRSRSSDDLLDIDFSHTSNVLSPGSETGSASSQLSSQPTFSHLSESSPLGSSDSQSQSDLKSTSSSELMALDPLVVSSSSLGQRLCFSTFITIPSGLQFYCTYCNVFSDMCLTDNIIILCTYNCMTYYLFLISLFIMVAVL